MRSYQILKKQKFRNAFFLELKLLLIIVILPHHPNSIDQIMALSHPLTFMQIRNRIPNLQQIN